MVTVQLPLRAAIGGPAQGGQIGRGRAEQFSACCDQASVSGRTLFIAVLFVSYGPNFIITMRNHTRTAKLRTRAATRAREEKRSAIVGELFAISVLGKNEETLAAASPQWLPGGVAPPYVIVARICGPP